MIHRIRDSVITLIWNLRNLRNVKRSWLAIGASILVGAALAAASPLFPAISQSPHSPPDSAPDSAPQSAPQSPPQSAPVSAATPMVQIQAHATLQRHNRTVVVQVQLDCGSASTNGGMVELTVRQRVGNRTVRGTERTDSVACDGTVQDYAVPAQDGRVFHPGTAVATAQASVCTMGDCAQDTDTRRIQITH